MQRLIGLDEPITEPTMTEVPDGALAGDRQLAPAGPPQREPQQRNRPTQRSARSQRQHGSGRGRRNDRNDRTSGNDRTNGSSADRSARPAPAPTRSGKPKPSNRKSRTRPSAVRPPLTISGARVAPRLGDSDPRTDIPGHVDVTRDCPYPAAARCPAGCRRRPYTASAPSSPVRMRTSRSTSVTQTLPSPILPVAAAWTIVSTTVSTWASSTTRSMADLRHEVDLVLGASVGLGVAALAAEATDFRDGHAGDAGGLEGVFDVVELERLDDCGDEFHGVSLSIAVVCVPLLRRGPCRRRSPARPCSSTSRPCDLLLGADTQADRLLEDGEQDAGRDDDPGGDDQRSSRTASSELVDAAAVEQAGVVPREGRRTRRRTWRTGRPTARPRRRTRRARRWHRPGRRS